MSISLDMCLYRIGIVYKGLFIFCLQS